MGNKAFSEPAAFSEPNLDQNLGHGSFKKWIRPFRIHINTFLETKSVSKNRFVGWGGRGFQILETFRANFGHINFWTQKSKFWKHKLFPKMVFVFPKIENQSLFVLSSCLFTVSRVMPANSSCD